MIDFRVIEIQIVPSYFTIEGERNGASFAIKKCWSTNHTREKRDITWTRLKKHYIKRDRFDDNQRITQYMIDYIVDYESYNPDVENLIDDINVYTINFTLSTFKFFHSEDWLRCYEIIAHS